MVVLLFALVFGVVYMGVNDAHEPYVGLIEKYSKDYSLDEALVASIIKVESDFRPEIKSDARSNGAYAAIAGYCKMGCGQTW